MEQKGWNCGGRLAEARAFIEREFRRSPSLDEIARAADVSVYHFHRLFRRAYGKTPKQLVEELRIAEVKRLAVQGMPFSEVWRPLGFATQSHMGNRFKRVVGKTPREWLREVRAKGESAARTGAPATARVTRRPPPPRPR